MITTTKSANYMPHPSQEIIKLGEIVSTTNPNHFNLLGIGSCLIIYVFDLNREIYYMAHTLLPKFDKQYSRKSPDMPAKFTDIAICRILKEMYLKGSSKSDIQCKIVGGGQIYKDNLNIGYRNIQEAKLILEREDIPINSEEIGGNETRSILSFERDGSILIRKKGKNFTI
jgi:chemotaxis protein CheD